MEYKKIKKLGEGNQGTVWLVENKNTKTQAAMKKYPAGSENAKREIDVLRQFGGEGIPYLIDFKEEDGICIVMEFVEGKTLRNLMQQKKIWNEKECIHIVGEIAKILSRFHRQVPAVIYGDLKPENIVIGENQKVHLVDFGSVLKDGERHRKVYGTKAYIPPEEEERVTPYRDTYALGAMMYEMLTGSILSEGIENGKADVSHLSPICRKIMQKAVRLRKESGYPDAGQMYEELKKCKEQRKEQTIMNKIFGGKHLINKDYFITDLKRVVLHGYKKGLCLVIVLAGLMGIIVSEKEIEAAKMQVQEEVVEQTDEIPRDEYGRKLVIRR